MNASATLSGILAILLMLPSAFAEGLPLSAELRVESGRGFPIQGLAFYKATVPIQIEGEGSPGQELIAMVGGVFNRPDWILVGPGGKVLLGAENSSGKRPFEFKVPLTAEKTVVHFVAIDPFGKTQEAAVTILYPGYLASSQGSNEVPSLGAGWGVALGVTSNSFSQTGSSDFSEIALTAKLSYQRPLSSHWDLGGNIFSTVLPVSANQAGVSAYFLGVNARAGYALPFVPKPWTISLATGLYFATMVTNGGVFGYQNVFGPQIFPVIRRSIGTNDLLATYLKYSPVSEGGASFGFSSHELATGLSFTHLLPRRHSLSLSLDYSQITVKVAQATATNTSVTGGVAYGF